MFVARSDVDGEKKTQLYDLMECYFFDFLGRVKEHE